MSGGQVFSGTKYKNEYRLTPKCFKLCALRSQNIDLYAHYYLLIEMSMAYFSKYQIKLEKKYNIEYTEIITEHKEIISEQKNIITQKDDKIDKLQDQLTTLLQYSREQMKKSDEQIRKSDKILKYNVDIKKESKRTKKQLNNITEKLDNITEELVETKDELVETKEILEDTNNNVRLIAKKLDIAVEDRVCRTDQSSTDEYLTILKSNTNINNINKYYFIRSQQRSINARVNAVKDYHKIKSIKCVPNAVTLFNLIKQNIKDNIYCHRNIIDLLNINENNFLTTIDNIYDERKIVEIN